MFSKKAMVTALATAALVCPAAAPALPADQVPPPPSSIAVSAADEYSQLRDPARGAKDLRSPDTRDQATGYAPTVRDTVGDDVSASGFDVVSGALGLAAGIALATAAVALAGLAGTRLPRRHTARS